MFVHAQDPFNRFRKFTRRAFLSAAAACSTAAGSAGDDEAVRTRYLAWLRGRVAGDFVGLDSYRKQEGRRPDRGRMAGRVRSRKGRSVKMLAQKP